MLESNLLKILEYGKIPMKDFLVKISEMLNLELYSEEGYAVYTLSSESFVLDVENKNVTLIFVDETLNEKSGYIQQYLNYFLKKKHIFYCLLKYIVNCTASNIGNSTANSTADNRRDSTVNCTTSNMRDSSANSTTGNNIGNSTANCTTDSNSLKKYKSICTCILTGKYCKIFNIRDEINIFTHRKQDIPLEYFLSDTPAKQIDSSLVSRISDIFTPENFSLKWIDLKCSDQISYEYENVKVKGKSVFINDERSKIASFAFLKGVPLSKCIQMHEKLS